MSNTSVLQHLKQLNRNIICEISQDIKFFRELKRQADEQGNLAMEYEFHNSIIGARRELKKFVELQVFTKKQLRAVYAGERQKRRQAQIDGMIDKIKEASGEVV